MTEHTWPVLHSTIFYSIYTFLQLEETSNDGAFSSWGLLGHDTTTHCSIGLHSLLHLEICDHRPCLPFCMLDPKKVKN